MLCDYAEWLMSLQNNPIRYIQEYLALQKVLAPQPSLHHPGIERSADKQLILVPLYLWTVFMSKYSQLVLLIPFLQLFQANPKKRRQCLKLFHFLLTSIDKHTGPQKYTKRRNATYLECIQR